MTKIHHLNCVKIVPPMTPDVVVPGHCLLLEDKKGLVLIDTGIGLKDIENPFERIGEENLKLSGIQFEKELTAFRQIENLGLNPEDVTDCVISHLDVDHTGGLADFPKAKVHVSREEYDSFTGAKQSLPRYSPSHLAHNPPIVKYSGTTDEWFGFEAGKLDLAIETDVFLIPLFGHTHGHCGVAVKTSEGWLFYVGDAYYLRVELTDETHPIHQLTKARAENNALREKSLDRIRNFVQEHPQIEVFCYHDIEELFKYQSEFPTLLT